VARFELESLENGSPDFQALTPAEKQASRLVLLLAWRALLNDPDVQQTFTPKEIGDTTTVILQLHVSGSLGRASREKQASQSSK